MARRLTNWRVVLLAGVVATLLLASVGLVIQRSAVGIQDRGGLPYVEQPPTPFEYEVHLERDHNVVLADGDEDLWYFAAGAVLLLTLGSLPLLRARGPSAPAG
ncbi:MAG: hypothetical protein AB7V62_13270 [Thermoleophilia bacterium]